MLRPAGFWRRYVAYSLDALLLAGPALLLLWPLERSWARQFMQAYAALQAQLVAALDRALGVGTDPTTLATQLLTDTTLQASLLELQRLLGIMIGTAMLIAFALAAPYFIGFERSRWQATPGKRALGLRVTDLAGNRLDWRRAAGRFVAGLASWATFNLGHALAAWTPDKRALHDYLAGTRVLLRADADPRWPWWAQALLAVHAAAFLGLAGWCLSRYAQALMLLL